MLKFIRSITLFSALTFGLLWSGLPSYAACVTPADLTEAIALQQLKSVDLKGDAMRFFLQEFEKNHGAAPMEFDELIVLHDDESAVLVVFKSGCQIGHSNPIPAADVTSILKEAGL